MKKVLTGLILLTVLLLPSVISAQEAPQECCRIGNRSITVSGVTCSAGTVAGPSSGSCTLGGSLTTITCPASSWGMICLLNTIYNVTDWIFVFLVAIVSFFIIWGGVDIVMSGGSDEKLTGGRKKITYAAVGLGVAILAKVVPSVVKLMIGSV